MDGSVSCLQVKEENLPEDHSTLLHQHMNQELEGGIVSTSHLFNSVNLCYVRIVVSFYSFKMWPIV